MTDDQLSILLRAQIGYGLVRHGFPTVLVARAYQPTTQGRTDQATVYFFPVSDARYGWQHRTRAVDIDAGTITTTEAQWIESMVQVFALVPQNPRASIQVSAKDLVNTTAMICNSEPFVSGMRVGGAGIQRVTAIRSPFFTNDRAQFEESPSFDITISHKREITEITPVSTEVTHRIFRV